ncbi:DHA2 family efflux MFS transporter permease subunit [Leucobacter tardus]|uniref:DHA2 family efflux MFS transporter permease subunit n=1 Tax=Leucobacter tardus TaxID=501483 RepID=A0A939TTD7_9MICO|nr:DHA2 family efflux MFS transporter permease subunit [Leucobacter tardus]MBO2988575.1 DHA2 family efflux MFS transporter permease subunit [Leucobacter tardus]
MSVNSAPVRPWAALWAMVIGFFMILVDTTIVSVANPSIMSGLGASLTATLWATSAYLLAYAVPLLITGRLGDRFGQRRVYLIGLTVFTLSSLACGLAGEITTLIIARVFQGLGAALMTPQTMAVITRIFGPRERGSAMAVWGVTAGVATLVGPILGGFLLDGFGWEWIFFINVPVGVIAFALALKYVPKLETSAHRFDGLGVLLSAVGMFLVVFGIQEGEAFEWGRIWGPVTVWMLIAAGLVILALFVVWQRVQRGEPLMPLVLFRNRNFSVGSATIVTVGATITSLGLPIMFYFQLVEGLSPTRAALMLVPTAVVSVLMARPVGTYVDAHDSRRVSTIGLGLVALGLLGYAAMMWAQVPVLWMLVPSAVLGFGNSFMWGPLASITTFSLDRSLAGAGSGVYNTGRQVGAVLGAAAMAALMQGRITAQLGAGAGGPGEAAGQLPEALREGFGIAMGQSLILPVSVIIVGLLLTLCFAPRPTRTHTEAVAVAAK